MTTIESKYRDLSSRLDESTLRAWAATEARSLGHGGISLVAKATGLSRTTIHAGLSELKAATPSLDGRRKRGRVREAMADTPVVLIAGPRQAGKTTLVRRLAAEGLRYLTLDDETSLLAARQDPVGFVRRLDRAVIDEIQRAPGLLLAIKKSVDEDRRPGRFLLKGSANLMALPMAADSLAGRMETLTLLPLSQSEIHQSKTNWLDAIFDGTIPVVGAPATGQSLVETVMRGGYPEAVGRATQRRRTAWIRAYITALIQRDVREIAGIDKLRSSPQFLNALAFMAGQLCNYSQLGKQVGLDHKTAAKYVTVFEQMFLLQRVEAWASNGLNRVLKTPKLQFTDSGVLSALTGLTPENAQKDRTLFGKVLETFVFSEIRKHGAHSEGAYRFYYYRDRDQYEVDVVIENIQGDVIGRNQGCGDNLFKRPARAPSSRKQHRRPSENGNCFLRWVRGLAAWKQLLGGAYFQLVGRMTIV